MFDPTNALALVKARLDRLPSDTTLDAVLAARIDAAAEELGNKGIHLNGSANDTELLVDLAVYNYRCRDSSGGMPEWLRYRIRERWLNDRRSSDDT